MQCSTAVSDAADSSRAYTSFTGSHMSQAVSQVIHVSQIASQGTGAANAYDADMPMCGGSTSPSTSTMDYLYI